MSSGCAHTAMRERTPVRPNVSIVLPGVLGHDLRHGQRRVAVVRRVPQHPRTLSTVEHVLELGPVLERVGGPPETLVPVGEQLTLRDQAVEGVRNHVLAVAQLVYFGGPIDYVATVLEVHLSGHRAYAGYLAVVRHLDH